MLATRTDSSQLHSRRPSGGAHRATITGVLLLSAAMIAGAGPLKLFGPKGDTAEEARNNVRKQRDEMLSELYAAKPELKAKIEKAPGYATFKQTDVNLLLLASGNGYGMLVDNTNKQAETFMRVASLGGGVGMGVKDLRVVFIFNDAKVMQQFVDSGWQFSGKADASAKAGDKGASAEQNVKANVDFKDGTATAASSSDARAGKGKDEKDKASANAATGGPMEVYQFTQSGVSLQATVSGTKYWKDDELNKKAE